MSEQLKTDGYECPLINIGRNRDTGELIVRFDNGPYECFVKVPEEGLKAVGLDAQSRVAELEKEVAHAEFVRKRFCAIVPDLVSQSWEDIWERVREMVRP